MLNCNAPAAIAARFEALDAHHGPIEGDLKNAILGLIFTKLVNRYFEFSQSQPLGAYVEDGMRRHAPDVLSILELAQDWTKNPKEAARRQLRPALEAKAKAEREERERREEAELRAAVAKKAEEFVQGMTGAAEKGDE